MKVAFPTEDGRTISAHLGKAPYYLVAIYEEGSSPSYEQRDKAYHGSEHHHAGESHMSHAESMLKPIADCQALISGGMGMPVYQQAVQQGLQVILTGIKNIPDALEAYRKGELTNDPQRIHFHHNNG